MNKKNILYACFIFFAATILFQITVIIKLNQYEAKINQLIPSVSEDQEINESQEETQVTAPSSTIETTVTSSNEEEIESTTMGASDYSDLDLVFQADNLSQLLDKTLFIGDSRTEGLYKFTPAVDYAAFCCGAGYNISTIREQTIVPKDGKTLIDSIANHTYENIFVCLGYNELGWDYPDTFISRYEEFIQDIHSASPDAKLYIIGILNVYAGASNLESYENNIRIEQYNSLISEMCQRNQAEFLNFNRYFTDSDGNLIDISTEDGIHFTAKYYNYYLYRILEILQ